MATAAEVASTHATTTLDAATRGVHQVRSETLPEISRLVEELHQLATSLRSLSQQTKTHPSSLLVGAPVRPPGPGEKSPP